MTLEVIGCNDCPFFKMEFNDEDYSTYCKHPQHKTVTNKDIDVKIFLNPITPEWCPMDNGEVEVTKKSIFTEK